LKKEYFSSHKLPKQRWTSFWSQGILGVKKISLLTGPFHQLYGPRNGTIGITLKPNIQKGWSFEDEYAMHDKSILLNNIAWIQSKGLPFVTHHWAWLSVKVESPITEHLT
jgi:hypothetical protein